jgi:hypothetical protein
LETRRNRRCLIPHLKDAKRRGYRAFLKDKLMMNRRTYDFDYVVKNIQLGA